MSLISENIAPRNISFQPRILAGVLFSISKYLLGEVFPVYMGQNLIGCSEDSDIRLQEATVSPTHACIHVLRDEEKGTYSATIDGGSGYDFSVNGLDARYETLSLNDGDILDIGSHYRLLFRLFNSEGQPLFENEDFEDISEPQPETSMQAREEENPLENLNQPLTIDFYAPSAKSDANDRTIIMLDTAY